jgi:hypothetical protein
MNNVQAIEIEKISLIQRGIIQEGEEIHTFNGWKERGFSVKKGEKACATFQIWRQCQQKSDDGETESKAKMRFCKSFWFSERQVEPLAIAQARWAAEKESRKAARKAKRAAAHA